MLIDYVAPSIAPARVDEIEIMSTVRTIVTGVLSD